MRMRMCVRMSDNRRSTDDVNVRENAIDEKREIEIILHSGIVDVTECPRHEEMKKRRLT
jgi:hypothetical protein